MKTFEQSEPAALHVVKRRVFAWGICIDGLVYNDEDLRQAWRKHDGDLCVDAYRDPANIVSVLAAMPDGSFLKATAHRRDYAAGRSIEEHLAVLVTYGRVRFFRNVAGRYAPLFEADVCGLVDGCSGEMAAA